MKPNYYWLKSSSGRVCYTINENWPYILKIEKIKNNVCTCIIYEYETGLNLSSMSPSIKWHIGPDYPLTKTLTTGQISERIRLGVLKLMTQDEVAEALLRMI